MPGKLVIWLEFGKWGGPVGCRTSARAGKPGRLKKKGDDCLFI